MKKNKQNIKCDVYDCIHCNCDLDECELKQIKVCNCDKECKKTSTMCDSYENKKA